MLEVTPPPIAVAAVDHSSQEHSGWRTLSQIIYTRPVVKGFNTFYVARIQLAFQNVFGDSMTACLFRAESRKKFEPF